MFYCKLLLLFTVSQFFTIWLRLQLLNCWSFWLLSYYRAFFETGGNEDDYGGMDSPILIDSLLPGEDTASQNMIMESMFAERRLVVSWSTDFITSNLILDPFGSVIDQILILFWFDPVNPFPNAYLTIIWSWSAMPSTDCIACILIGFLIDTWSCCWSWYCSASNSKLLIRMQHDHDWIMILFFFYLHLYNCSSNYYR